MSALDAMIAAVSGPGAPEVALFILDAGGGHRSAANALVAAAEAQGCPWRFRIVSLQEVLAPLDLVRRLTGRPSEQTYNVMVRGRQTLFLVPMLRAFQWLIRLRRSTLCDLLAAHLGQHPPHLVISLIPNFNGVIRDAVRRCRPETSFFVLLTDFADVPPRFWMEVERGAGGRLRRVGFTDDVSEYLSACDVLVTKPGPGSLAEAFHQQVPMVVACNAHTIPQERHNARIVQEGGLGVAVRRWREMPAAVTALRGDPERLDGYRRRLAALPPNRAVFEVLELVERTLEAANVRRA